MANLLKVAQRKLDDGDAALDVLRLAADELGEAQAELRDLARGLHPVALSERGLRGALESLTAGCRAAVTLDVDADDLPDEVELAAYFIVSESLTNARSYAGAAAVRVRVAPEATCSSSRSPTTAAAVRTRHPGRACAGSPTGSTRSAAGSTSTARAAGGPASARACRSLRPAGRRPRQGRLDQRGRTRRVSRRSGRRRRRRS